MTAKCAFARRSRRIHGKDSMAIEEMNAYSVKTARLVDAVIEGVDMLATRPENYRRVMLILGESRDRGSKAPLTEAIERISAPA